MSLLISAVKLSTLAVAGFAFIVTVSAQSIDSVAIRSTPMAATSASVVPMLVRYDGVVARGSFPGSGASMTFLIYKEEKGGEPLWIETQNAVVDALGKYEVYLGSTYSSGLPPGLFGTGEARWLEVQIAGETPGPRTLLTSVPYALKAADAATLGGLPASAFVLASAAGSTAPAGNAGITSDASAQNVTTTGGTNFYVPRFNGATTIINSQIYDNGTSVGIGDVPNASAKLDVNGAMIMRGNMTVSRTGNATASKAFPSYGFDFFSNVYNSSSKATVNPYFQVQSEPTGNDTASPSATFNLLFSNNGTAPAETGFSINPDGTINFASGQTFSGYSTTGSPGLYGSGSYGPGVSGTSQTGDGIYGATGGATSGTAGVYGKAASASGLTGIAGIWGDSSSQLGVLGTSGTNSGVKGLIGGGTLNTAGVLGLAGTTSGFGGIAGVWGDASAHVGVFGSSNAYSGVAGSSTNGPGLQGASTNGPGVQATSTSSYGGQFTAGSYYAAVYAVNNASSGGSAFSGTSMGTESVTLYANAQGKGGTAIEGVAVGGNDSNGVQPTGVYGYSTANGVLGDTTGNVLNTAGVLGIANGRTGYGGIAGVWGDAVGHIGVIGSSDQYPGVLGNSSTGDGVDGISSSHAGVYGIGSASSTSFSNTFQSHPVGVWGDTTGAAANDNNYTYGPVAVAGTTTYGFAGKFTSNDYVPTLYIYNYGSGGSGDAANFQTLQASTPKGTCGFSGSGDMTCTGQVKALATTGNGARTVETYSMQSPENWMEDFGTGTLHSGAATVSIETAFAETVSANADYHVFLTPRGDSKGLYVANLTASSFEVHESGGGISNLDFDYRIVARRRGFETQRMVDVTDAMKTVKAENDRQLAHFKQAAK